MDRKIRAETSPYTVVIQFEVSNRLHIDERAFLSVAIVAVKREVRHRAMVLVLQPEVLNNADHLLSLPESRVIIWPSALARKNPTLHGILEGSMGVLPVPPVKPEETTGTGEKKNWRIIIMEEGEERGGLSGEAGVATEEGTRSRGLSPRTWPHKRS